MTSIFRIQLKHLGFSTDSYASHSFHIGATTTAAEAGLAPFLILTLDRWSSNCYTQYIHTLASVHCVLLLRTVNLADLIQQVSDALHKRL